MKVILLIFLLSPIIIFQGFIFSDVINNFKKANERQRRPQFSNNKVNDYNNKRQTVSRRFRAVK